MNKQTAKLKNWKQITFGESAYLEGIVSEHPTYPDGQLHRTSEVIYLDWENKTAETRNTIYTLGEQFSPETRQHDPEKESLEAPVRKKKKK